MNTHITTHNPVRSDVTAPGGTDAVTPARPSRLWAVAGIVAGIAGLGTMVSSMGINAGYDEDLIGNSVAIAEKMETQTGSMLAMHLFAGIGAVTMIVFAAGLHRRLRARTGDGISPMVAFAGLLGTAFVTVMGTGLTTEFLFGFWDDEVVLDPSNAVFYGHWVATIPWVWVLAGLSGVAVFVASRAGAVPRWIGIGGLGVGGLTLLLGISPLQYMAGMTGPIWLLATALAFTFGDRAFRRGE